MNKMFKSNKIVIFLLFIICFFLLTNPKIYANVCLDAVSSWATKVFPLLFPMMVLTRLIISLSNSSTSRLDKLFCKIYNLPAGSFFTFLLSVLAGYPTGAKLVAYKSKNENLNSNQVAGLHALCSIPGPMFMLGSVGVAILCSFKAGIIVFMSNLIAVLINGLIYKNKVKQNYKLLPIAKQEKNIFSNAVYEATISALLICSYMILSFVLIELFNQVHLTSFISNSIYGITKSVHTQQIANSILSGSIEMTNGILDISLTNLSLSAKTIVSSCLVCFGGLSVFMQCKTFLGDTPLSNLMIIKQKITQTIICLVVSWLMTIILY